jgi:hypothetical protein
MADLIEHYLGSELAATWRRLFAQCSLSVADEGVATLLAGPFVGHTLARSERFIEWNARVTDKLPRVLASGWSFALRQM